MKNTKALACRIGKKIEYVRLQKPTPRDIKEARKRLFKILKGK